MNLVFGSIFLFILISPGLIFRFSYLQGTYAKLTFKVSAIEELFWALVPALFFQGVAVLFLEHFLSSPVRLDIVYSLITATRILDFNIIRESLPLFLLYTFSLIVISVLAGIASRFVVRKLKLDLQWQFLRFGNEWHYLLSGELIVDPTLKVKGNRLTSFFQEIFGKSKTAIWIQIDTLVSLGEGHVIYSGILENYYLSKENGLDRIYLRNVYRRKLKDDLGNDQPNVGYLDRHLDARYYSMPGDLFVITYDKIINLNITYYINQEED